MSALGSMSLTHGTTNRSTKWYRTCSVITNTSRWPGCPTSTQMCIDIPFWRWCQISDNESSRLTATPLENLRKSAPRFVFLDKLFVPANGPRSVTSTKSGLLSTLNRASLKIQMKTMAVTNRWYTEINWHGRILPLSTARSKQTNCTYSEHF